MPYLELSVVYRRWRYWWANKLRAVTGTRQAKRRCSVVISLIIAIVVLLLLVLPLDQVASNHLRDKQDYVFCSLGYYMHDTFVGQFGHGYYINDTFVEGEGPLKEAELAPPSRLLYQLSTKASRADPHTVAVECWFTNIDLAFTTAELTCMTTIWGEYAKQPSLTRVKLPNTVALVVSINGAEALVLRDTDTPGIVNTSVVVADSFGVSGYPDLHLPFQVLVSVFLENSTDDTSGSNLSPLDGALWNGFTVWLWVSAMPMYQVKNGSCAQVPHRNYTVVLTGEITMDTLSYQLLVVMNYMMWSLSFTDMVLTVMLYLSHEEAPASAGTLLTFSATLLFALPTMRAIWPAAPPTSSTKLDVMTIFPQLFLVSEAVLAQLLYLALWQPAGSTVAESGQWLFKATASSRQQALNSLPVTRDLVTRRQLAPARSGHGAQAVLDDFEI